MRSFVAAARVPWKDGIVLGILIAAVLCTFRPVLDCDITNYDDPQYLNLTVQQGLTAEGFRWAWTTTYMSAWHPLTWLSLMLDSHWMREILGGIRPSGYHAVNLLLHLLNTLLLFGILRRLTGSTWRSFVVAALFALHPLHVQPVAWISERKGVLSSFFGLLALGAYAVYASRPGIARYALVVLFLALSLLAKPMLVTFPVLLLLLDFWPLERFATTRAARLFWEKIPLFALAVAGSGVAAWSQWDAGHPPPHGEFSPAARCANAIVSYIQYLRQTFYPVDLAAFYPFPEDGPSAGLVIFAAVLLGGLSLISYWLRRRYPYFFVGWLWYVIAVTPVIGFVAPDAVGLQARADRYTYLPLVGVFLVLVWGLSEAAPGWRRQAALGCLAVAAMVLLAMRSWTETQIWRSSETLWNHALETTEGNYMAYWNRGDWFIDQGRYQEAERDCREALRLWPQAATGNPVLLTNLGFVLLQRGAIGEAKSCFVEAVAISSDYAEAHNNLGHILILERRYQEAADEFRAALRCRPNWDVAENNLRFVLDYQKGSPHSK